MEFNVQKGRWEDTPNPTLFSVSSRVHAACATDVVKSCTAHYQSSLIYTQLLTLTLCPFKQQSFKVTSRSALDLVVTHRRTSCTTSVIRFHHSPRTPNPTAHFRRCWAWRANLAPLRKLSQLQVQTTSCLGPWLSEQSQG